MGMFGDIGNIFHSIGHFLSGHDDNNNKNNQPQNQSVVVHPVLTGPTAAPNSNNNQNRQNNNQNPTSQNNNQQQQQQDPLLRLYQGPSQHPDQPLLAKAPSAPQPAPQPSKPHASIFHDITHNNITNAVGTAAKDVGSVAAGTSLGVLRAGEGLVQGVTDIPKLAVDLGTAAGDKLTGTHARPQFVKNIDQWTNDIDQPQQWLQKKTDEASQAFGQPGADVYKPIQIATNVATAIPAASAALAKVGQVSDLAKAAEGSRFAQGAQAAAKGADAVNTFMGAQRAASPTMQMLDKVNAGVSDQLHGSWGLGTDGSTEVNKMGTATDTKVAAGVQRPDEVTPGLSSVNPNQGADALKAIQQKEAEAAATAPLGQATESPATPPATAQPTPQQPLAEPASVPAGSPAPPTVSEPQTPPQGAQPTQSTQPIQSSSEPPIVNTPNNVAQTPNTVNTAPNAPKIIDNINKEIASNNPGNVHEVMEKQAMAQRAHQVAQTTDLPTAIAQHAATQPVLQTPQDAMDATALMRRMYAEAKDDPAAKVARDNLANAVAEYGSKGGQAVNVMKDVTAGLPPDAKASVMAKTLAKVWKDDPKRPELLQTDAGQAYLEDHLTKLLEGAETNNNDIARLEGEIEKLGHDPTNIQQMHELGSQLNDARLRSMIDNGQAGKFVSSLLPARSNLEKLADWARTSMLSSLGGRLNNLVNVGANSGYETATSLVQSQLNKVFNHFLGDNSKLSDVSLLNSKTVSGTKQGFKQAGAEFSGKTLSNTPVEKLSKAGSTDAYGMSKFQNGPITKFVHAAVNAPKNLFGQGIKDSQIYRLARQEGLQQGLKGGELDAYSTMRSYVPSRQMEVKGQELMDQVSHTNKNWLSNTVGKWAEGGHVDNSYARGAVGLARNTVLPFAKYPATYLWNTITDRNLIADTARFVMSLKRGDMEGVTKALSRAVVDGTLGATGYHLASAGYITGKDGDGYSDGGMYLHFGNRYIPLGWLGVVGEPLLGGAAIQTSLHSGGGNPLENFGKAVAGTAIDTVKLGGAQSLIGTDNTALTTLQDAVNSKGGVTGVDAAAAVGAQAAGQFIPGATSDVNAVLNHSPMNPTGERPLTKVTKGDSGATTNAGLPSKAKDIRASSVKQLEGRIPGLSQTLPRNPGTTAPDMIDRVTRGSHVGGTQQAAIVKATAPGSPNQNKANLAADKAQFLQSNKETSTINGKTWVNINGSAKSFDSPQKAQQAIDEAKFRAGQGGDFQQKNGMVYERGSNGKVTAMEQKDYDYKQASDAIKSSKDSGDLNGTLDGQSKLLDNVQWQLNHADLTPQAKSNLVNTAAKTQADFNKYQLWGSFTKPKGAPSYDPTFTGGNAKTSAYVKTIREAGAKYGVDINAMLSVAAQEGLGGGVGDNGTSFGPFQLHEGGALPAGKDQAWAESPEGIDYAVKTIASVAKGKVGPDAIKAIVTQFERSADQPTEIANALSIYEGGTANLKSTSGTGSSLTSSGSGSGGSGSAEARVKSNVIGNLPVMARESFIENGLTAKPVSLNLPQIKLTNPETLIKAHKITVGMPKA